MREHPIFILSLRPRFFLSLLGLEGAALGTDCHKLETGKKITERVLSSPNPLSNSDSVYLLVSCNSQGCVVQLVLVCN